MVTSIERSKMLARGVRILYLAAFDVFDEPTRLAFLG